MQERKIKLNRQLKIKVKVVVVAVVFILFFFYDKEDTTVSKFSKSVFTTKHAIPNVCVEFRENRNEVVPSQKSRFLFRLCVCGVLKISFLPVSLITERNKHTNKVGSPIDLFSFSEDCNSCNPQLSCSLTCPCILSRVVGNVPSRAYLAFFFFFFFNTVFTVSMCRVGHHVDMIILYTLNLWYKKNLACVVVTFRFIIYCVPIRGEYSDLV